MHPINQSSKPCHKCGLTIQLNPLPHNGNVTSNIDAVGSVAVQLPVPGKILPIAHGAASQVEQSERTTPKYGQLLSLWKAKDAAGPPLVRQHQSMKTASSNDQRHTEISVLNVSQKNHASQKNQAPRAMEDKQRAAIQIQRAWRDWSARVEELQARSTQGERYYCLHYPPKNQSPQKKPLCTAQQLGMLNYVPVKGRGPVLSAYQNRHPDKILGRGAFSEVESGPRGYVSRYAHTEDGFPEMVVDPSVYADIPAFIGVQQVSAGLQIARNAGCDLRQYILVKQRSLQVSMFKKASEALMNLHKRKFCHNDITLFNMTYKKSQSGEETISFIDCDRLTNQPAKFLPTVNPFHIVENKGVAIDHILHEEYAFLRALMIVHDLSFYEFERPSDNVTKKFSGEELEEIAIHDNAFVTTYIRPEYREAVLNFLRCPMEENAFSTCLHDMIDWEAAPVLISSMYNRDVDAIQRWGRIGLDACTTSEQRQDYLFAARADGVPGLYWLRNWSEGAQARQAWKELVWMLPETEQIQLRDRFRALAKAEEELLGEIWFSDGLMPIRKPTQSPLTLR